VKLGTTIQIHASLDEVRTEVPVLAQVGLQVVA